MVLAPAWGLEDHLTVTSALLFFWDFTNDSRDVQGATVSSCWKLKEAIEVDRDATGKQLISNSKHRCAGRADPNSEEHSLRKRRTTHVRYT